MNTLEFKKLIREEVKKLLSEASFKVGDTVTDDDREQPFKVVMVFKNRKAAIQQLHGKVSAAEFSSLLETLINSYLTETPTESANKPHYLIKNRDNIMQLLPGSSLGKWSA